MIGHENRIVDLPRTAKFRLKNMEVSGLSHRKWAYGARRGKRVAVGTSFNLCTCVCELMVGPGGLA